MTNTLTQTLTYSFSDSAEQNFQYFFLADDVYSSKLTVTFATAVNVRRTSETFFTRASTSD